MKIEQFGLNTNQWAQWRRDMLATGTYDPNEWHRLNDYQKRWTKDTLNTLRQFSEYENGDQSNG